MMKRVETTAAPAAIGPYSQGVNANGSVYVSGQLPIAPKSGTMPKDIQEQTRQSLENVSAILAAEGLGMKNVVKTTVLLQNIEDFSAMNEVYAQFFTGIYPARAAFQVAALPKGALVEIEAIACKE